MMAIFGLKTAESLRKEELKFATTTYGAVCVERGLISLMPMLLVKHSVFQVSACSFNILNQIFYTNIYIYIYYSEPIVYTDSHFGDGDGPIVYSNLDCEGYEDNLNECDKSKYGNFSCSRKKVVGIKCQEGM